MRFASGRPLGLRWLVLAALCGCWSTPRPAPPVRDTPLTLPMDQLVLANGIRVLVVTEPAVAEVSVTTRFSVGAGDDPAGKPGLAHLVEHLLFEQPRSGEAVFDYLDAHTLEFNGFTTGDSTIFTERAPPSQLGELLELEAARVTQACGDIPHAAFARQLEIVRNELRERANDDRVHTALDDVLFSNRHSEATADTIATLTQADACAFVADHYAPANAVIVVSGHVTATEARPILESTLGQFRGVAGAATHALHAETRKHAELEVPVDRPWIVMAWPLSDRPAERARVRAVTAMAVALINSRVNGLVKTLELGSGPVRQIAIAVAPSSDISVSDAMGGMRTQLRRIGEWFGTGLYEHAQNGAIYRFAAALDHATERDIALANEVAAGRDARAVTLDALAALKSMTRNEANQLVHAALDPDRASVVVLRPSTTAARAAGSLATTAVHEQRRRRAEDPAEALRPVTVAGGESPAHLVSRTLANGLRVILLPESSLGTVDVRLVLPVGTGDEGPGERGVASVAAHALAPEFDADQLRFAQAGGYVDRDVDLDRTELSVQGMAGHLDLLLSGLAATAREGLYDTDSIRDVASWMTMRSRGSDQDRIASDAWRAAVFGDKHPYRFAGVWLYAERAATDVGALRRFRAAHYVPDGATLIVAGHFDMATADRWIDFYFGEWAGAPAPRTARVATLRPLALAQVHAADQIAVDITFPAPRERAVALVVTELVEQTFADAREELAASYGLHAQLVEHRLSTVIEVHGFIDATRAAETFTLLRDRLARLRVPGDTTAGMFVAARRRALSQLVSSQINVTALADAAVHDIAVAGQPRWRSTAEQARVLTIADIEPVLSELDLNRAAILLRGPESAVAAGYAAIERRPTWLSLR